MKQGGSEGPEKRRMEMRVGTKRIPEEKGGGDVVDKRKDKCEGLCDEKGIMSEGEGEANLVRGGKGKGDKMGEGETGKGQEQTQPKQTNLL